MRLLLSVLFGHRLYKIVSRLDQERLIEDEGCYPFVGVGHGSSSSHARVAISARKVSPLGIAGDHICRGVYRRRSSGRLRDGPTNANGQYRTSQAAEPSRNCHTHIHKPGSNV